MSLDIYLYVPDKYEPSGNRCIWDRNITHNLNRMAEAAGVYTAMWRPEELEHFDGTVASILPDLIIGLQELESNRGYYEQYNPTNGWGTYVYLIEYLKSYIEAAEKYYDATVEVSR